MKLFTGKAEQDFESWYYDNEAIYDVCTKLMDDMTGNIQMFYKLPFSMQSGVYMEWLRSVGIEIEIEKWIELHRERDDERTNFYYWIIYVDNVYTGYESKEENIIDYNTAQTEAIKQAGKIYNERGSK